MLDLNESGHRFFTTSEVAGYCGVSNDGVLKWIRSGKLRAFSTPGGHYRIGPDDFRLFLQRFDIPVDENFLQRRSPKRTVLVVDDERYVRDIVRRLLEQIDSDLIVEEAGDGYEAGIKIGTLKPCLVVLDVQMPRVDGISLCRSIRGNPKTEATKVIVVTGYAEQNTVRRVYEAGADLCLTKPIQFEQFRLEVTRLLEQTGTSHAVVRS